VETGGPSSRCKALGVLCAPPDVPSREADAPDTGDCLESGSQSAVVNTDPIIADTERAQSVAVGVASCCFVDARAYPH